MSAAKLGRARAAFNRPKGGRACINRYPAILPSTRAARPVLGQCLRPSRGSIRCFCVIHPHPTPIYTRRCGRPAKGSARKPQSQDPGAGKDNPKPAVSSKTSFLREEEKGAPLAGIAAVAFILLLVSAALFYLHVRNRPELARLSAAPAAKTRVAGPVHAGFASGAGVHAALRAKWPISFLRRRSRPRRA